MKINYSALLLLFCIAFLTHCKDPDIVADKKISVTITPDSLKIRVAYYTSWRLTAKVLNADNDSVIWTTENPRIATVNEKGFVTAVNKGVTYIVATVAGGDAFAKCKVTVVDDNDFMFRLVLKDKGQTRFSIDKPEEFLSAKAIERRRKQQILVNETDLPISDIYIKEIEKTGAVIVTKSKWLKTVTIKCSDYFLIDKLEQLPFVEKVLMVWKTNKPVSFSKTTKVADSNTGKNLTDSVYGDAFDNINLNNGQYLHELGYKGAGIDIAVIDAAFADITTNKKFANSKFIGAKSFIFDDADPYGVDVHGVWVTSCMAVNIPGVYVGTAPEANYLLLRSEDINSEFPVEQDYWVAAAEYADSLGIDIINTSLYYTYSNLPSYRYSFEEMDGNTQIATRGANMAADKGIFIVCCAGNESKWVGTPADSPKVLTVGAVDNKRNISSFSSFGLTVDNRLKPDVVALGSHIAVIPNSDNYIDRRSGTSYSSPVLCGLAACLWQANPKLTSKELLDIIKKSADKYNNPVLPYGYGIPDMKKANELAREL